MPIDKIKKELKKEIENAMRNQKILGFAISLIDKTGILWSEGFGCTDHHKTHKVDTDTLFSIQSTGKTLTATAFLRAVQKGLVNLDDTLITYYPDFTVNHRFDSDEVSKITFRHLLSHRSGLTHEAPVGSNYDDGDCTFEEHIESIADTWLRFPVGSNYSYSNLGMDLVAYTLQLISGNSFPEYVRKEVADPLTMDTLIYGNPKAMHHPNVAIGYTGPVPAHFENMIMYGAGCPYTSVNDLSKYVLMQLNNGVVASEPYLREDLLKEMRTIQYASENQKAGYGLGLVVSPHLFGDATICHHSGGGYGYIGTMMWVPDIGLGVVVQTNQGNGGAPLEIAEKALTLLVETSRIAIPEQRKPKFTELPEISLSVDQLKRLEGSYISFGGLEFTIELKGSHLVCEALDSEFILTPRGEYIFTTDGSRSTKFVMDDDTPHHMEYIDPKGGILYIVYQGPGEAYTIDATEYTDLYRGFTYGNPCYAGVKAVEDQLYLFIWDSTLRLEYYRPNLFFTVSGEAVEFENGNLLYGNRLMKKYDVTLKEVKKAAEEYPENRMSYMPSLKELAAALQFLGRIPQAIATLEIATSLEDDAEVAYRLAELYYTTNKIEKAQKFCNQILENHPDFKKVQKLLSRF
ncbi:MAG: serine hydrolase [Theionarchaea archaeon]|nr:serine hydrolase [Theionarchaea archaeon]